MEIERSGASVEEAVEAALAELGVSEQEAEIEVLQEPRGGFLGLGSQQAVVRVRVRRATEELDEEALEEQGELAADFLEELLQRMGIEAAVEPTLEGATMYVDLLEGGDDDTAILIGRHGQTLEALQELTRTVVARRTGERARVVVDVEGYRRRRRDRLAARAREVARRVKRTGREEELEPMNPFERKIVHDAVAEVNGVTTASRGEEPERRVVIRPRR
ncbi:MAG TPA: RNA-binding cell elongation regulator Jag/EloR [Actinomycetota bacterium]|nr:RNA-binding cell elongation regulator Jag/EloR [Actinomycetota bacterium]